MPTDTYTSTASSPWVCPAGVTSVTVIGIGEGGKGGNGVSGSFSAGGGGGGEWVSATFSVTPGNSYTFTIGAGGTGTDTVVALDNGTLTAHHGNSGSGQTGGTGGTGSTNTTHHNGGTGATGTSGANHTGAGGGGSGGSAVAGNGGSGTSGGTAVTGGGSGGNGAGLNGSAGGAPGGGGGGGGNNFSSNGTGGAGAAGKLSFTYTPLMTSTGSLGLKKLSLSGTVQQKNTSTGSLGLKKLSPSGHVSTPGGIIHLKRLGPGGTVFVDNPPFQSTGSLGLKKLSPGGQIPDLSYPFPATVLQVRLELLVNGVWTDITDFVMQRTTIVIERGKPDEQQNITPSSMRLTLNNRDGRFSPNKSDGAFYPFIGRNTQIRLSISGTTSITHVPWSGYRYWGEVSQWPPKWDPTGTDISVDISASGVFRRYVQGTAIGSTLRRYYKSIIGGVLTPSAIWPGEDGGSSSLIGSMLSGGSAMEVTGNPGFGGSSAFGGASGIPSISSSVWHGTTGSDSDPPGTGSITRTTPGIYKWVCPPGVTSVTITRLVGGGGGGGFYGSTQFDGDSPGGGGGGGGGEWISNTSVAVTPGVTYTYIVPAGGTAAATDGQAGGDGAAATFAGDSHTATAHGGHGGQPGTNISGGNGGSGGSGSSDTVHHNGGAGGSGAESTTSFDQDEVDGHAGSSGGGNGGTAQQISRSWESPITGTVTVVMVGGGGGGEGGGNNADGHGGGGGGGGGYVSSTFDVVANNFYQIYAGCGGNGNSSGAHGDNGSDSWFGFGLTGALKAGGGKAGSGAGQGGAGGDGDSSGSSGGNGYDSITGHGMGGGGGGGGSGQNPGAGADAPGPDSNPREPGAGGGNGSGGGWGAVSNGGSGATPGGSGQSYGGGGGGGGGVTLTSGKAGGGGGAGRTLWQWEIDGVPTGGGGGSSGGSTQTGNSGSSSGAGGAARSQGGAGGAQGVSGSSPGGGGGGGVPQSSAGAGTSETAPGNGANGLVSFSWDGGVSSPVAANILTFLLDVDSAGSVDGAVVARMETFGTINELDVIYHTASSGSLEFKGYTGDTVYFDHSGTFSSLNGQPVLVRVSLTESGTSALWKIEAIEPGATSALTGSSGTVSTVTIGNVSDVYVDPDGAITDQTAVGWLVVQTYADTVLTLSPLIDGYRGETVADRLQRVCDELGITFTLIGDAADTPQMGPQADQKLLDLFQACEDMDMGQLYESRDAFGLTYRTRVDMQGQNPALILDYSHGDLSQGLQPTADDAFVRNDITVTRVGGSSATKTELTGALSILDPPDGVGEYPASPQVYAYSDSQLEPMAEWQLSLGTVEGDRYPVIPIQLSRTELADVFADAANIDIGDYIEVVTPPDWLTLDPIQQIALGYTESLNAFQWDLNYNAVPEAPYGDGNPPTW